MPRKKAAHEPASGNQAPGIPPAPRGRKLTGHRLEQLHLPEGMVCLWIPPERGGEGPQEPEGRPGYVPCPWRFPKD